VPSSPSDSDTRPTTFGALHGQLTERHEKGDRPHLRGPDHVQRSSRPGGQLRVDHRAQALPPAGRFRPGCHLAVCQGKTEEIQSYPTEIRGAEVSKDTIRRITDAVIAETIAWQNRPVDAPYRWCSATPSSRRFGTVQWRFARFTWRRRSRSTASGMCSDSEWATAARAPSTGSTYQRTGASSTCNRLLRRADRTARCGVPRLTPSRCADLRRAL
jgi:hypothetical protein